MGVRNISAGETAKAKIEAETGKTGVAEVWAIDLSSYNSVKVFAKKALELERIDGLIENAGVAAGPGQLVEGHNMNVTVNVLSTILLAVMLLPKMSQDAHRLSTLPHIAIVVSGSSFEAETQWNLIRDDPIAKIDSVPQATAMA
jgi:NAD(P)-dependent dehydrogenase (short-subunit alcohol dehydrogenase family)